MMNALRLTDGFPMPLYAQHTGLDLFQYQGVIEQAMKDGLLTQDAINLKATERGGNFLNDLLDRFMPDTEKRSYPVIKLRTE